MTGLLYEYCKNLLKHIFNHKKWKWILLFSINYDLRKYEIIILEIKLIWMETCWLKFTRRKQLTTFVFFPINQKYNLCLTSKLMFFKLKRIEYCSWLFLVCLSLGNYLSEEEARTLTAVRFHDFIFQNIAQGEMSLFLLMQSLNR